MKFGRLEVLWCKRSGWGIHFDKSHKLHLGRWYWLWLDVGRLSVVLNRKTR